MADRSGIQWTDATWNPIRGCSRVSAGCQHCYAEVVAARFSGPGQAYEGLARRRSNGEAQWTGDVRVIESHMLDPIRWRRPRKIFVNSMGDLFHENVIDETIDRVFAVMAAAPRHVFQVLTKRPERMLDYMRTPGRAGAVAGEATNDSGLPFINPDVLADRWPLPNVWLGVSVENQAAADERIPLLLDTPAAIRFLSCEPLLGPLGLAAPLDRMEFSHDDGQATWYKPRLGWIIVGGESGRGARPFDLAWARDIVAQCANAEVPCFVKQMGANPIDPWGDTGALVGDREPVKPEFRDSHGGDMAEWPADLRVREFPEAVTA